VPASLRHRAPGADTSADRGASGRGWRGRQRAAPAGTWDQDFHYSQLDLQAAIDLLQWFKDDIAGVLEQIREHNAAIPVSLPPNLLPDLGIPGAELR
jgi:hypothetical protein